MDIGSRPYPEPHTEPMSDPDIDEIHDEDDEAEGGVAWSDVAMIGVVTGMLLLYVSGVVTKIFGLDAALLVTLAGGYGIFWDSLSRLSRGKMGGDLAVTIAAFAALAIGQFAAAAEVVLIMLIGTALEGYVVEKTRGALAALLGLAPDTATVRRDGHEITLPIEQIVVGDSVIIRPGERIPVDGVVQTGQSAVDQSALTGESLPLLKQPGDEVFTGTINTMGLLEVEARAVGEATTLAQIIRLVAEAQARKAPVERLADRWAGYFVPIVLIIGALTFAVYYWILGAALSVALTRMAATLIIACPCALILATPTGMAAALGRCARRGILMRGGAPLEALARVNCVIFDKTGTLTQGRPEVVEIVAAAGRTQEEVLRLAATAEQGSAHPLSAAVRQAYGDTGTLPPLDDATYQPGLGMTATQAGQLLLAGNRQLLHDKAVALPPDLSQRAEALEAKGNTVIFVAAATLPIGKMEIIGLLAVTDRVRPEAASVVSSLKALGIERILMLTGDSAKAAQAVAGQIGITEVSAHLFPADKMARLRALQAAGYRVAMIGDGINDAPALAAADVGVAMGHGGADIAVETAGVVFVADDLARLPETIVISRRALSTIRRNILWFAIGLNSLSVILSASGALAWLGFRLQAAHPYFGDGSRDLSPILAAVEHQIASLLVVTSSLRLLYGKPWRPGDTVAAPRTTWLPQKIARWTARLPLQRITEHGRQWRETARQNRQRICLALVGVVFVGWLMSGFYSIAQGEVGVAQRFGRLIAANIGPGLHYRAPWPIDKVTKVNVAGVRRAEIGFRTRKNVNFATKSTVASPPVGVSEWSTEHRGNLERVADESLLLTGDEYFVEVNLTLQYRISNSSQYLFSLSDAESVLHQAGEAALRRAAGQTSMQALLTTGRGALEAAIARSTQSTCDSYGSGIEVLSARLQDVHPPQEVVPAYRNVSSAEEEKSSLINQAQAYRNETIPLAHGEAAQNLALAGGYAFERAHRSSGDASRFTQMLTGYRSGPQVNANRMYLETVEQALAGPNKFVMDPRAGGRRQMWLSEGALPELPGLPAVPRPQQPSEEEE